MSRANFSNVESSRAEILPKVERVIEKFNGSFKNGEKIDDYNTQFEPDVDHIDQKLVVDDETGHIIGTQRPVLTRNELAKGNLSHLTAEPDGTPHKKNYDMKFEFQGPIQTDSERHNFKTIQDNYKNMRNKRNSLSDLVD